MSSTTLTIGELAVKVQAAGLGGANIDTAVASEFDVEIEYTYLPSLAGSLSGGFEDAEEDAPAEVEIKAIKACANVHFEGDMCDTLIRRGSNMLLLFTGREIDALADRILDGIERSK